MQNIDSDEIDLGKLAGLDLSASPSALVGSAILWIVLGAVCVLFLRLSVIEGVALGLIAVLLHWLSAILHQLGHARAARRAGHPMSAIRLWGVLSSSVYPPDEPSLPPSVHIRRALGGPILSLVITLISSIFLFLLPPGTILWWLVFFFVADNLLVFTLGALLPLGFTDGTTLLHWVRRPD
jgi:hypothetical protein